MSSDVSGIQLKSLIKHTYIYVLYIVLYFPCPNRIYSASLGINVKFPAEETMCTLLVLVFGQTKAKVFITFLC